jgi:hypothetical protein
MRYHADSGSDLLHKVIGAYLLSGKSGSAAAAARALEVEDALRAAADERRVVQTITKADVAAVGYDASGWHDAGKAFMGLVEPDSLLGSLPLQPVPFSRASGATIGLVTGAGAAFTAEGLGIKLSKPVFDMAGLVHKKVTGMIVLRSDFAEFVEDGETFVLRELARAVRVERDKVFAGSAAGSAAAPAGVAKDASTVASTGATVANISADVSAMIKIPADANLLDPGSAVFLTSPKGRSYLAMSKILDADGRLASLRCIAHPQAAGLTLVCCNRVAIASASDQVVLRTSDSAMVEMSNTPTGDTVTPTAASQKFIGAFQSDALILKAVIWCNLSVVSPQTANKNLAVVSLTSATWT